MNSIVLGTTGNSFCVRNMHARNMRARNLRVNAVTPLLHDENYKILANISDTEDDEYDRYTNNYRKKKGIIVNDDNYDRYANAYEADASEQEEANNPDTSELNVIVCMVLIPLIIMLVLNKPLAIPFTRYIMFIKGF